MQDGVPTPKCPCGHGMMVMKCAGKAAKYANRFNYKCPLNRDHPGSFKWFDEHAHAFEQTGSRSDPYPRNNHLIFHGVMEAKYNKSDRCARCCVVKRSAEFSTFILVSFMSVMLVLFGIVIGKLL